MNSKPTEIGERIKAARKKAGLNQTELATRLNKTLRTVQKYESGEIEPSIAMVNEIAKILEVSPADLIGYTKPAIEIETLSDVIAVLHQLSKKANLHFTIDVERPPHHDGWSCSLRFDGQEHTAPMNAGLCLFLEEYKNELEKLETYWTDQENLDLWVEKRLAYHATSMLEDKKEEPLTLEERIRRRNELDRQMLEKLRQAGNPEGE